MLVDLGKVIVTKGFKKFSKVQKIARSGHTGLRPLHKQTSKVGNFKQPGRPTPTPGLEENYLKFLPSFNRSLSKFSTERYGVNIIKPKLESKGLTNSFELRPQCRWYAWDSNPGRQY